MVSTRFGGSCQPAFICQGNAKDYLSLHDIVVDVTPEKRYVLWDQANQRFLNGGSGTYTERMFAQTDVDELNRNRATKRYCIVEFDYPGEQS